MFDTVTELRYTAWGESRGGTAPTSYRYTGQRESEAGLYFYNARYFDPKLGRFVSADSIIPDPGSPISWDRYAYSSNNPINYNDPSGHAQVCVQGDEGGGCGYGTPDYRDLTDWIVKAADYTANYPDMKEVSRILLLAKGAKSEESIMLLSLALGKFKGLVQDGAIFDFKDNILSELGNSTKLGSDWFEYSTSGNILYGYYGASTSFSKDALHLGAGFAQAMDYKNDLLRGLKGEPQEGSQLGPLSTIFDTPDDYAAVEFGYALYLSGTPLTCDVFIAKLQDYRSLMALTISPGTYSPATTTYAPDRFNNK